ncbi:hypothetical protein PCAR4_250005 [Paraburkholderia caribensis]|nr:hypothetical protein PCAR4_250005 [Paraburkholderia caribensis]
MPGHRYAEINCKVRSTSKYYPQYGGTNHPIRDFGTSRNARYFFDFGCTNCQTILTMS